MAESTQQAASRSGAADGTRRLNLGCGYALKPESEGWVNVDGFSDAPGVVRMDMARTPWPFPDAHFDEVYARHALEHIPPVFEKGPDGTPVDAFMRVMEEAWRVLKPGGTFRILVPDGESVLAIRHWQHYRMITPEWWEFFNQAHPEATPYRVNFEVVTWDRSVWHAAGGDKLRFRGAGFTTHLAQHLPFLRRPLRAHVELRTTLRKLQMPGE